MSNVPNNINSDRMCGSEKQNLFGCVQLHSSCMAGLIKEKQKRKKKNKQVQSEVKLASDYSG